MIVIESNLLEKLGAGEQRVVLAHELGHILSDHVLYMTALDILMRAGVRPARDRRAAAASGPCGAAGVDARRRAEL